MRAKVFLETERLVLRRLVPSDAELLFALGSDRKEIGKLLAA